MILMELGKEKEKVVFRKLLKLFTGWNKPPTLKLKNFYIDFRIKGKTEKKNIDEKEK